MVRVRCGCGAGAVRVRYVNVLLTPTVSLILERAWPRQTSQTHCRPFRAVATSNMVNKHPTTNRRLRSSFVVAVAVIVISLFYITRLDIVTRSYNPFQETGYVLAFMYSDQLTGGAVNLLSLMCLATELGEVRVVEPFVVNSDFGLNASKRWTEQLKFRDINDISIWKRYTSTKHYNPLVSYETFIKDAPRKVLLVQYRYPCGDQTVWSMARDFCNMNGFELVGKVCLSYGREKTFTIDVLENHILTRQR